MIDVIFQPRSAAQLAQALLWVTVEIAALWVVLLAARPLLRRIAANRQYLVLILCQFAMGLALPLTLVLLPPPNLVGRAASPVLFARSTAPSVPSQAAHNPVPTPAQHPVTPNPSPAASGSKSPAEQPTKASAPVAEPRTPAPQAAASINWWALAPYLCWLYVAMVVLLLLRLIAGCREGQRLINISEPIKDTSIFAAIYAQSRRMGLSYVPAFARCDVVVPCVVGFVRPTLLLPLVALTELSPEQIEMVIAHELAHIRRFDPVINMLQRVIEAFLFFHPAVWHLSREIKYIRECCCDDMVLHGGPDPIEYAQVLARLGQVVLARLPRVTGLPIPILAAGENPSQLRLRIGRLLKQAPVPLRDEPIRLSSRSTLGVVFISILLCGLMFKSLIPIASASPSSSPDLRTVSVPSTRPIIQVAATQPAHPLLHGITPLHSAVAAGTTEEVQNLLKAGAPPDALTTQGWSPLVFAAYQGRIGMMGVLLDAGANPNLTDRESRTPLFAALGIGPASLLGSHEAPKAATVDYLISRGANINVRDKNGMTPLHAAVVRDLSDICQTLISHGADINALDSLNRSPVVYACQGIAPVSLQLLVDGGANLGRKQQNGWSLFEVLALQPREAGPATPAAIQCAAILRQHGLVPELAPAVALGLVEDVKRQLANRSPDLQATDHSYQQFSPLYWAVRRQNVAVCHILLDAGAQVDQPDSHGSTPLVEAVFDARGHTEIVEMLLAAGADANRLNDMGRSPVFDAFQQDDFATAKLLASHGARLDLKSRQGRTPFDCLPKSISREDVRNFQSLMVAGH